jgi:hypothetical protein
VEVIVDYRLDVGGLIKASPLFDMSLPEVAAEQKS